MIEATVVYSGVWILHAKVYEELHLGSCAYIHLNHFTRLLSALQLQTKTKHNRSRILHVIYCILEDYIRGKKKLNPEDPVCADQRL